MDDLKSFDKKLKKAFTWRLTVDQIFFYTIEISHVLVAVLSTVSSYLTYEEKRISVYVVNTLISGLVIVTVTLGKLRKYNRVFTDKINCQRKLLLKAACRIKIINNPHNEAEIKEYYDALIDIITEEKKYKINKDETDLIHTQNNCNN